MQKVSGALIEETFELIHIIIHYRHQAACRLLGEPLHLKFLDV